ncbi:MAG TPA: hypothetical protein VGN34_15260 [Ktedonobacteraceae bacterium]
MPERARAGSWIKRIEIPVKRGRQRDEKTAAAATYLTPVGSVAKNFELRKWSG